MCSVSRARNGVNMEEEEESYIAGVEVGEGLRCGGSFLLSTGDRYYSNNIILLLLLLFDFFSK